MSVCQKDDTFRGKKGDAVFDQTLHNIGIECTERRRVLLTICLPMRLLLAGIVLQYGDRPLVRILIGLGALFSVLSLSKKMDDGQYWNRRVYLILAVGILLSLLFGCDRQTLGGLMFLVALKGIHQAFL
jgi:hypothetical protein